MIARQWFKPKGVHVFFPRRAFVEGKCSAENDFGLSGAGLYETLETFYWDLEIRFDVHGYRGHDITILPIKTQCTIQC